MSGQRLEDVHYSDIILAKERLKHVIRPTPLLSMETLNIFLQQKVYLKAECLLPTGSFKLRGAYNKIASISKETKEKGIITASAGNHAMGVSLAAKWLKSKATVVVPQIAPEIKKETCRQLGAEVIAYGDVYDEAYAEARKIESTEGKTYIHPVADADVIAGQGTIGLEILEQLPEVKQVVVPLGGGGLVSGIAIALKSIKPSIKVIAVQAEGSPVYYRSFKENKIIELETAKTIADGLSVKKMEPYLFEFIKAWVDDIVLVREETIKEAMKALLFQGKLVAEGAGAVSLAAMMDGLIAQPEETVLLVSGANVDQDKLFSCIM